MLYFIDEDPASPATVLLVLDVLRLALRLNIPRLRGLCARYLHANLGFGNVIQALHAAHHANLNCIKEVCLRYSKNLKKKQLKYFSKCTYYLFRYVSGFRYLVHSPTDSYYCIHLLDSRTGFEIIITFYHINLIIHI